MRVALWIVLAVGVLILGCFGLFGLIGLSAAHDQCPGGSDCYDATMAAVFGLGGAVVGTILVFIGALMLRRRSTARI